MIRVCDTNKLYLRLVYEMWDSMICKIKMVIYDHEGNLPSDFSSFYDVIHRILLAHWTKHSTPLHCLAYSLNPR